MTDRIAEIKASVFEGHTIRRVDVKYLLEQLDKRDVDNERLRETNKALESDNYNAELNNSRLLSEIERLKEAQRWIPLSRRMPNSDDAPSGFVLECEKDGYMDCATVEWVCECTKRVTHWMPLPAPPTDRGDA